MKVLALISLVGVASAQVISGGTFGNVATTYPSYEIPTATTYPSYERPTASTYPSYEFPTATTYPSYEIPTATTYPSYEIPTATTYPSYERPTVSTYPSYNTILSSAPASKFPSFTEVQEALKEIVADGDGFGLEMWATIVDRDGLVKMVVKSGDDRGDQWPGSRVISAQKANTANAFSLPGLALSTANLYAATQPGGSLYGLQHSNPVDVSVGYKGPPALFGTRSDPMVGKAIGGVNVFGGGLALYNEEGELIGGLGLSGDSSVADHIKAWKLRHALGLDFIPGGVSPTGDDNMVLDLGKDDKSAGGWGHPATTDKDGATVDGLPDSAPISTVVTEEPASDSEE